MSTPTPIERAKAAQDATLARLTAAERLRRDPRAAAVVKAAQLVDGPCRVCQQLEGSGDKAAHEAHAVHSAREAEQMARDLGLESKVARRASEIAYRNHGGTVGWSKPKVARKAEQRARRESNRWLAKEIRKRTGAPKGKKGATWRAWIEHRRAGGTMPFDAFKKAHRKR